ncbi:MAG: hypothetical protein ACOCZC_01585 [Halodesulfurarchaeum sp.]
MEQDTTERLESIVDRLTGEEDVTAAELQEIAEGLETGKKYTCATCQMFCTGEDIMVIYDTEDEEFIQIEVPMDESAPLIVTRVD